MIFTQKKILSIANANKISPFRMFIERKKEKDNEMDQHQLLHNNINNNNILQTNVFDLINNQSQDLSQSQVEQLGNDPNKDKDNEKDWNGKL